MEEQAAEPEADYVAPDKLEAYIRDLETQMKAAARELAFERAAVLRDRIKVLKQRMMYEF